MLCDETAEPKALPLSLLQEITGDFSDEQEIGRGGFAVVYQGKLENRTVAVKRMSNTYMYEKEFQREVQCLMIVKHKNVVRFLGYCADTQGSMEKYDGKFVMADVQQRLLCFEYLPKGSLHEYITDSSSGLQWRDRYRIIKGVCQGLHHLHQQNIVHLDLKPANILLDDNFVAKIADFGLSRCFDEMQSRVITVKIGGTLGYLAPEFGNGEITYQFDIYSLGVIITEILTGKKGYHAVDNVVGSWSNVMEKSRRDVQLEQVRVCAEIGIECTNFNPANRPDMQYVINRLAETETIDRYIETGVITSHLVWSLSQQAEHAPNELRPDTPNTAGEASSEVSPSLRKHVQENAIEVTVTETSPYNSFWKNTAKLEMLNAKVHILNETMRSIWLSYQLLNPDIRRCLEYCSIFPRRCKLRRNQLVALWIAQGFVKTSCATEDMEDVAEGYIQELVSCSFLQPQHSWDKIGCFTIHDVVHGLLDKVARNCFRIENADCQGEEGWNGDVPRDVQHLFVEKYDTELITGKILGLENLCTLIVYGVEEDTIVEERVIESICKRLLKLRVLAIAFSQEHVAIKTKVCNKFSVPESISQLKRLRYLAFRIGDRRRVILPSTINKLQHIQLLDFGEGNIGEFNFGDHVNLRYIICYFYNKQLPNIGGLISLQTLGDFEVSNKQGYKIKQLRDLNKLRGCLCIKGLEDVRSKEEALEANLAAKERLTKLELRWHGSADRLFLKKDRCSPEVEAEVLEGLCPPLGLEKLEIWNYHGTRYPDWMVGKQNGGLQELVLWDWGQLGPAPQLVECFPHLHVLKLWNCSWYALPGNMEHLTSLRELVVSSCPNIRSLPTLPQSLEGLRLAYLDDDFIESCQTVGHPNWQKIEHVCNKRFT
ncbi:hypothetical protein CFC21_044867 [Triticum aestivum]|uniref:Protein kinase domain-containing protein n=2 Tax=Triticum aestivum TaxID=4565 RepID=A0A3B6FYY4_WHEAT|nr:hypothetical protein CFC21_044867 [Triticum aestivum]